MGGVVGRILNEFAVVVTVAILASMFVSLTLTPMLASRLLRAPRPAKRGASAEPEGEAGGHGMMLPAYDWLLRICLKHRFLVLLFFLGSSALSVWLLQTAPKGFFPQEDIGQLSVSTEAREDISFDAMSALQGKVADVFAHSPYVAHVASSAGGTTGPMNNGRLFV